MQNDSNQNDGVKSADIGPAAHISEAVHEKNLVVNQKV